MASPLLVALRTDHCNAELKDWFNEKEASGFAVKEGTDNPHVHWYLELMGYKNVQSFRVQLTKKFPALKGNAGYSAKPTDDTVERYWQYMCKGDAQGTGVEVFWRQGLLWTDERIEELHTAYWEENGASKRQKLAPIFEVVFDKLRAAGTRWSDREAIAHAYIKELVARGKGINIFAVKSSVNLIAVKLAPLEDDAIASLAMYAAAH